jgi:hypothetical protein
MFFRASTLAIGATESSRSRNTWSASSPFAFSRNLGFEPGVARQDRRERNCCGFDMPRRYDEPPLPAHVRSLTGVEGHWRRRPAYGLGRIQVRN